MSTSIAKADCGCGGHGTAAGGCGCGGNCGGGAVCTDASFRRPRFFAGQLLTEDDLQALTDYVVGKNRLHNRFLFGDGVVCGLTATCHPCGGGQITVSPGFALDCCGNDVLVPCKEELDVKALIRDLRKRQLAGYDCGDPCDRKNPDLQSYGLYIRYAETLEDPVTPYASGDPCGQQACEATRVCEGYRFELRCDCALPARSDLFKRVAACIGDLRQAAAAVSKAQSAEAQMRRVERAVSAIRAEAPVPFDEAGVRALREEAPKLARLNEISLEADLEEDGVPRLRPDERELRLQVARMQLLTGAITRLRALPEAERAAAMKATPDLDKLVAEVEATLAAAGERIELLAPRVLATPTARSEAEDSVRLARKYALSDAGTPRFDSTEARLVALNAPLSFRQASRVRTDLGMLKEWLLEKLEGSASLTRCDLADQLRRVRLDTAPQPGDDGDTAELAATGRAVRELVRILLQYLIDCICLALNPPCQPCEDQGVLLACLKVRDCEVVDICNMSRRFVLSPVALRYWLPPIGAVGELFQRFCCEFDLGKTFDPRPRPVPVDPRDDVVSLTAVRAEEMTIAKSFAPAVSAAAIDEDTALVLKEFRIAPQDVETVTAFSSNLALLSTRSVGIEAAALAGRGTAVAEALAGRLGLRPAAPALDEARLRARVVDAVAAELPATRKAIERELAANVGADVERSVTALRGDLGERLTKDLTGTLGKKVAEDVKSAVARELTEAKLRRAVQGTDTVKALRDENRQMARELKRLGDAIDALRKGGQA